MTNNFKKDKTIKDRQSKKKELILEHLQKMPILQIATERAGISRASFYRWREQDENFKKAADEAIIEGEALVTDMSESQLISLIRDKNFAAIQLWLKQHHPKYATKIEVMAQIKKSDEQLTPEQEKIVKEALRLASYSEQKSSDSKIHD